MSERKLAKTVTVSNPQGLHARPADRFAKMANEFESQITLVKDGMRVDGKSVLNILTLAASEGTELVLETEGPDAEAALDALAELVQSNFEDDQIKQQEPAS